MTATTTYYLDDLIIPDEDPARLVHRHVGTWAEGHNLACGFQTTASLGADLRDVRREKLCPACFPEEFVVVVGRFVGGVA